MLGSRRVRWYHCSCLRALRGNGAREQHRAAHARARDGHRLLTQDQHRRLRLAAEADPVLVAACDCETGDAPGRLHRADPPCPAYWRHALLSTGDR